MTDYLVDGSLKPWCPFGCKGFCGHRIKPAGYECPYQPRHPADTLPTTDNATTKPYWCPHCGGMIHD